MNKNNQTLDYRKVFKYMQDFDIDSLNKTGELIIDEQTNTYVNIVDCMTIDEVKLRVIYALRRPIGKGLNDADANRLLIKINTYYNINLDRNDLLLMYKHLDITTQEGQSTFIRFVLRGFPIKELHILE